MEKLEPGERAPDFSAVDIHGRPVRLHDYGGRKVLLSFFRFATCPFCTVRFVRLTQEAERYAQQGLEVVAVFESSTDYIHEYLNNRPMPFPIMVEQHGYDNPILLCRHHHKIIDAQPDIYTADVLQEMRVVH